MSAKIKGPRYRVNVCGGDNTHGIYRMTFIRSRKRVRAYQFTDDKSELGATVALWLNRNDVAKEDQRRAKLQEAA